jgi:hypothetical protein
MVYRITPKTYFFWASQRHYEAIERAGMDNEVGATSWGSSKLSEEVAIENTA